MKEELRNILKKAFSDYTDCVVKPNIKPGHGTCCTCQVCGYLHDECNCETREIVIKIEKAIEEIILLIKKNENTNSCSC